MNSLELAQELESEAVGIRSIAAFNPTASGESGRLCNWIKQAHEEIQNAFDDWRWMRVGWTLNTVAGTDSYSYGSCTDALTGTAISRFARWYGGDLITSIYLQSAGAGTKRWLTWLEWDDFRQLYKRQPIPNGSPAFWTVNPQNQIVFGPTPDGVYVVGGDYHRSPLDFTDGADTPEFPSRFHRLVVWWALMKYGLYESAPEVIARAKSEKSMLWRSLQDDQRPPTHFANPLC